MLAINQNSARTDSKTGEDKTIEEALSHDFIIDDNYDFNKTKKSNGDVGNNEFTIRANVSDNTTMEKMLTMPANSLEILNHETISAIDNNYCDAILINNVGSC